MPFSELPATAAWRHRGAREGFEVVYFRSGRGGHRLDGHTTAVEGGESWVVRYAIDVDDAWVTRRAIVDGWSAAGEKHLLMELSEAGRWIIDGVEVAELDGCLDVDLESSACTNTLPVHRLGLERDEPHEAPAAYVRALDLAVERLEQRYTAVESAVGSHRYHYESPRFEYDGVLDYDASGLIVDYPEIATRIL